MTDAENYKELVIPKGGAKAFYDALTAMNDATCPPRKKKSVVSAKKKKEPAQKKGQ